MESVDALVGDSNDSENDVTPNSSIVNEMPAMNQNQHSISNRSSAQTTFINHERKPSIANIATELTNNENLFSRSSFSSNEDGSNKRPNKQEVRTLFVYFFLFYCGGIEHVDECKLYSLARLLMYIDWKFVSLNILDFNRFNAFALKFHRIQIRRV